MLANVMEITILLSYGQKLIFQLLSKLQDGMMKGVRVGEVWPTERNAAMLEASPDFQYINRVAYFDHLS